MSFFDDLRNLDRNNVGNWPKPIKGFFAFLIVAVILFLGGGSDQRAAGRSERAEQKKSAARRFVKKRPGRQSCRL